MPFSQFTALLTSPLIPSSKYGDLAATIAAVLLDKEARSVTLDQDPFKGNLREPLLRMMAFMRGMELKLAEGEHVAMLIDLDSRIGQMAHSFPTVFSFMLPVSFHCRVIDCSVRLVTR